MMIEAEAKTLIQEAVNYGVSDIHILPRAKQYGLYYRINGQLVEQDSQSFDWGRRLISYFKFMSDMDVGEKRRPQSGAVEFQLKEEKVELRFSTITNLHLHESLVIRVIRQVKQTAQAIHTYFPQDIERLETLIRRKSGLLLFSGPVGSGKTTTIYHLLRHRIQEEPIQVITMEDPVEIYEEEFLQTEVNERAGITYDLLIKSSLRHHPDILMIGEVRDEETARMCVRGALTGHLMIATIHAKDTLGVIARLQELRVSDAQLQQTLIGIISQRLVPRYCPNCQGMCQVDCQFYPADLKRAAVLELLDGQALQQVLNHEAANFVRMNDKLRKAWANGYIDEESYIKFEVI